VEYQWNVTSDFNLNAGVKYMEFTRDMNAVVNQTSGRQALIASRTDSKTTPSLTAHYSINPNWSAYAEIAQGFQAPTEGNSFYVDGANLASINVKPELSTKLPGRNRVQQNRFNADIDAYYVDFKNYAYSGPSDASAIPIYYAPPRVHITAAWRRRPPTTSAMVSACMATARSMTRPSRARSRCADGAQADGGSRPDHRQSHGLFRLVHGKIRWVLDGV